MSAAVVPGAGRSQASPGPAVPGLDAHLEQGRPAGPAGAAGPRPDRRNGPGLRAGRGARARL